MLVALVMKTLPSDSGHGTMSRSAADMSSVLLLPD